MAPEGADLSLTGEFSARLPGNYTVTAVFDGVEATALISVASDNIVSIAALDGFLWRMALRLPPLKSRDPAR